jgi:hypothetical protein
MFNRNLKNKIDMKALKNYTHIKRGVEHPNSIRMRAV